MTVPTIAVKESRADLLEIGPSTGLSGFKLVYVIGKGLYEWQTGDQSGNVPGGNGGDNWIAPSEDTSGKSGAWERLTPGNTTGDDGNVVTGTAGANGQLVGWNGDGDAVDSGFNVLDEDDMASDSDAAVPTQQSVKAYADTVPLQNPGTSSDPSLAFDTWRTPNASRPTFVEVVAIARTDSTSSGDVQIDIDESGGTTADYGIRVAQVHPNLPDGTGSVGSATVLIPAGGAYQINNVSDPKGTNSIEEHREFNP